MGQEAWYNRNMAIYDAIKNFNKQFEYEPKIENESNWKKFDKFVVAGMGGSNLTAGLVKICQPEIQILNHKDYGLPDLLDEEWSRTLVIASSYSGNTEETLDAYEEAGRRGFARVAISIGGKLLELAKKDGVPYVQMPDTGIQPRSALGYSFKGMLKLMGEEGALKEVSELAYTFKPEEWEKEGQNLAQKLKGKIPIIYSSWRNFPIAYSWKIKFNETAKIPAFHNFFPELNHTEMTGFDPVRALTAAPGQPISNGTSSLEERKKLNSLLHFIFLKDKDDHPRIQKRMDVTEKMYKARGLPVEILGLHGENVFYKIFSSLILVDWASYYLGENYGVETEQVPMVETFKGLLQNKS